MEHEEQGRRLERETDDLEERSDEVGGQIDEARRDWESKQSDSRVPGAQPEQAEESDQLPEDAPPGQGAGGGEAREDAEDSPGVPGEEETATGNPRAAGAEDPDDGER